MSISRQHFVMEKLFAKKKTIEQALKELRDHQTIVTAMAAAEPQMFFRHIDQRARDLSGLKVYCANPSAPFPCFQPSEPLTGRLELLVMFLTSKVSKLQGHDRTHYIPQHLSQWVQNLKARRKVHVFWGSCSKPDERGFVSLGLNNCYESEIFRMSDMRILEINPRMPRTSGSTAVSIDDVDHFVETEHPIPMVTKPEISEVDRQIAAHVAPLIQNESTIQLGIGSIPNAIGEALQDKKNLGVHTEMINDTMMELYYKGVITNSAKTIWPGKMVGSFVFGTQELYDFVDQNPIVELHPSLVVNDPYKIGQNRRMVSINTAVEVDLTGQVCSESVGHRELSGVGGASDTHVGAQRCPEGMGIIAIPSRTRDGKQSKIVFELKPGAKVSITRNDVDTIVTEFGVAHLKGLSVSERIHALVNIAHPEFRDELLHKAKIEGYI